MMSKMSQLYADHEHARSLSEGPVEETLIAASISILAEGVAIIVFLMMVGVWAVVWSTPHQPSMPPTIKQARVR